jgi:hypothetical protein
MLCLHFDTYNLDVDILTVGKLAVDKRTSRRSSSRMKLNQFGFHLEKC